MPRDFKDFGLREFDLSGRYWCVLTLFSRPPSAMIWFGLFGAGQRADIWFVLRWLLLPNAFEVSHDFCIQLRKEESRVLVRAKRLFSGPYLT